jgi:hypothetical protein
VIAKDQESAREQMEPAIGIVGQTKASLRFFGDDLDPAGSCAFLAAPDK